MNGKVRDACFAQYDDRPGGYVLEVYDRPAVVTDKVVALGNLVEEVWVPFDPAIEQQAETVIVLQKLPEHLMGVALDLVAYGVGLSFMRDAEQ